MALLVTKKAGQARKVIFALQYYPVFTQWNSIYRWALNPLDQPDLNHPDELFDSLEAFETVIEKSRDLPP